MIKKKSESAKKPKLKKPKAKPKSGRRGEKNLHVAKLEKKLRKISAHIKKCKEDLQSLIRLKQLQGQLGGK